MALTSLPATEWQRRPGLVAILKALGSDDDLVRFVGGAVRDTLIGLDVKDIDLATPLTPKQVSERLELAGLKAVPTGIDHGTVTAVSKGVVVEVTTLRSDVSTDGRRATVAFTDQWHEDAARRDFTINALYAHPADGRIDDFFDGLADLQAGSIRFIGDPLRRIAEDHLRILRFFRFHARFGNGAPDPAALSACAARSNDLMALSRERIADELLKLLAVPDPVATVRLMIEAGIFAPVLPEIASADRLADLVRTEQRAGAAPDPLRRLAALIPHEPAQAEEIAVRLRLSNAQRKRLCCSADPDIAIGPRALAYRLGHDCAVDRLLLAGSSIDALRDWTAPKLPIGGGHLISRGLSAGPRVARTLQAIEREWVQAGFPDGEQFEQIVQKALAANSES